ncbi:hypothetical protein DL93DRAFT_2095329 [Clavulina sp. PMI_390]|nr:hypothetical protein DL93DRAFT_2095329 [Clavulina sp. PMI_390]
MVAGSVVDYRPPPDIMTWIMLIGSTDILRGAVKIRQTVLLIAIPWLAFVAVFVATFLAASPIIPSDKKIDVPMMVRVVLLTVTEFIGAVMSILSLASAIDGRYADLVIASRDYYLSTYSLTHANEYTLVPFGAWLIFVTQRDVLRQYIFWAKFLYHFIRHCQRLSRNEESRHRPQETIVSSRTTVDRHLPPPSSQLKRTVFEVSAYFSVTVMRLLTPSAKRGDHWACLEHPSCWLTQMLALLLGDNLRLALQRKIFGIFNVPPADGPAMIRLPPPAATP